MKSIDLLPLDLVVMVAEHGAFNKRILRIKVDMIDLIVIISRFNVHKEVMSVSQEGMHDSADNLWKLIALNKAWVEGVVNEDTTVFGTIREVWPVEAVG